MLTKPENQEAIEPMSPELVSDVALATTGTPPAKERFARLLIERKFRIREVSLIMEISVNQAHGMLHDLEVMAHLDRLVTTGEAAVTVAGPREIEEAVTSVIRYSKREYYAECVALGIKPDPIAFLRLRMDAAMSRYKLYTGSHSRARKRPLTKPEAIREMIARATGGSSRTRQLDQ